MKGYMMRRLWLGVLLILLPSVVQAAEFFVGKAGSNANSCATAQSSTAANRKLTIGNTNGSGGAGCLNDPGDILTIGNGTYVEGQIQITRGDLTNGIGGTLASPITIRAENKWLAILSSTSGCNPNISLYASYITIDGLSLVIDPTNTYCTPNSASGTGIRMWPDGGAQGGIARNIKTDDPTVSQGKVRSHGIKSNQPGTILEDNELAAGLETLLAHNAIIRRNHITGGGNWFNGIVVKGGGKNVQVYNNILDGLTTLTSNGLILGGSNATDSPAQECFNCVAYNNVVITSANAFALKFQGCKDCAFFNNVSFNGSIGMSTAPSSANSGNTWKNNIISCNGANASDGFLGTYTLDYNNFYNCTGTPTQTHPIVGNPMFVNVLSDWHLTSGSTSLGSGQVVSMTGFAGEVIPVNVDYAGTTRVAPWSLGIYATPGTIGPDLTPPGAPTGLTVSPR